MAFLRVVEVLPPLFPWPGGPVGLGAGGGVERFTKEVSTIHEYADQFLIANVHDQTVVGLDPVYLAVRLRDSLGVEAAPVIVVRGQNRPRFLSSVLTAVAAGVRWMMIAWGDDRPAKARASNVRDYRSLADAIREASTVSSRARAPAKVFAPVDIERLAEPKGRALAKGRLRAGAEILLAQPPTTDADETFDRHAALIEKAGLTGRVLLNVFPFKGEEDAVRYERMFGWRLPRSLHLSARDGEGRLAEVERAVVRRLGKEGFPGVYLTTRGTPGVAARLLS